MQWLILQVIFAIILGPPAFLSLKEFIKIRRGEELIEKQNKITQPIVQAGSLKLGGNVNNFGHSNCNHQGFHSQK